MIWLTPDVQPSRSRYKGTFGLANGTHHTPILILKSVPLSLFLAKAKRTTPHCNALGSPQRLGNNARLVQQADGYGHTTLSQLSLCSWKILRAYLLEGVIPENSHTVCDVDEQPFVPLVVNPTKSACLDAETVAAIYSLYVATESSP
ncbi:hypothetical protein GLOTRDRAFT_134095 [Gloeophyllum trabeum ATCC 11539]|uniref:Peptidase S33 tripeptidyl aminopeptidase-like C-terminal domain-containing protein n=1 Tax=Gloeophyllum trabeum (strain ATCC 11539 / FP-39264 / Madison 617) TaxID=670483 RepID=S7PR21_GLOTA|nr:uncharacterized protein GLOTRDRAFT_134095 [Gloeophyllum trabeum ATCC 11539]EPQ50286.1 hypothetical protein GLOTRDRAFT_134095 [Gloeophyllum trabeum ATCC 11539]